MNISVDLGNFWDMLSAIGTMAAAFIALWLALDERNSKAYISFIWSRGNKYLSELLIHNPSNRELVIQKIELKYCGKTYTGLDYLNDWHIKDDFLVLPHCSKRMELPIPEELFNDLRKEESENIRNNVVNPKYEKDRKKQRNFKVIVTDCKGKKFSTTQQFSKFRLIELYFGQKYLN